VIAQDLHLPSFPLPVVSFPQVGHVFLRLLEKSLPCISPWHFSHTVKPFDTSKASDSFSEKGITW